MPSPEILMTFTLACALVIVSPGPDNILAIGRGLSQGKIAALITSAAAATGLLVHVAAATLGLAVIIQTSQTAFFVVKLIGAGYLIWLGAKAILSRNLISFNATDRLPLRSIFWTGFLTNVLNPKPAIFILAFILAFIPQFISVEGDAMGQQMFVLGAWFALMAFVIFAVLGRSTTVVAGWFERNPRSVFALNIGAGLALVGAGISVIAMDRK
ncbi:MAG: LysE family translocator [Paracoccaceae bacterium]|nr:LysE family translocator [Paracoccaceae bacterium]